MFITADHLRDQVIRPTLEYLNSWCDTAEQKLLEAAVCRPEVGLFSNRADGLGLYNITAAQHRDIWDRYLAYRPEIASRVRGLASQRAFLSNPDKELQTNLSYSTAIAWLLYLRAGVLTQAPAPANAVAQQEMSTVP